MAGNNSAVLLKKARTRFTQQQIASIVGVSARQVRRWEVHSPPPPDYLADVLMQRALFTSATSSHKTNLFTFIDLFAGIGGIRLGFEKHGGKCLFTSEWNPFAQKTYLENFPAIDGHQIIGDITPVDENTIPDHDAA